MPVDEATFPLQTEASPKRGPGPAEPAPRAKVQLKRDRKRARPVSPEPATAAPVCPISLEPIEDPARPRECGHPFEENSYYYNYSDTAAGWAVTRLCWCACGQLTGMTARDFCGCCLRSMSGCSCNVEYCTWKASHASTQCTLGLAATSVVARSTVGRLCVVDDEPGDDQVKEEDRVEDEAAAVGGNIVKEAESGKHRPHEALFDMQPSDGTHRPVRARVCATWVIQSQ